MLKYKIPQIVTLTRNTVYLAMNNNYMSRMDRIGKKSY